MTLDELYLWHREQAERYRHLAENHRTTGATRCREAVTRRNIKLTEFHRDAAECLKALRVQSSAEHLTNE